MQCIKLYMRGKKANREKNRKWLAFGNNWKIMRYDEPKFLHSLHSLRLWANWSHVTDREDREVLRWHEYASARALLEIKVDLLFSSDLSYDFKGCWFFIWVPQEASPEARIPKLFIFKAIPGKVAGGDWGSEPRKGRSLQEEHYQASSMGHWRLILLWNSGSQCTAHTSELSHSRVLQLGYFYIHQLLSAG